MSGRPWGRALAWLLFLAPFFFLTYNFSNTWASRQAHVATIMFSWERFIPFLAWTIVPYWSSDLLYAASLGICRTREELDRHAMRLLAIQIVSVACFLVFPLRSGFVEPSAWNGGWASPFFAGLYRFDQPFNQAPSLHIALAVILWARYREHTRGALQLALGGWFLLVAVSTLTTHQHQFIDVPLGAWAGVLVLAALPDKRTVPPQWRLTLRYLGGAAACTVAAFALRSWGWWLLWPGFALSMVAAAYWTGDSIWLGKGTPLVWLVSPYTAMAWINSRLWTRGEAPKNHLADSVWIGRAPSAQDRFGMNSVVALAPELRTRGDAHVAMLDLLPPTEEQLDHAVRSIARLAGRRPTLVCCALGYSRSALASAAWLISAGHAASADEALKLVRRARPQVVIKRDFRARLEQWADKRYVKAG